jgi:hypothetical protein
MTKYWVELIVDKKRFVEVEAENASEAAGKAAAQLGDEWEPITVSYKGLDGRSTTDFLDGLCEKCHHYIINPYCIAPLLDQDIKCTSYCGCPDL